MIQRCRWPRRLLAAGLLAAAAAQAGDAPLPDVRPPDFKADETYVFHVFREGTKIGTHEVRLDHGDGGETVRAVFDTRLRVTFLGFTVYRLDYAAREEWRDNQLERLRVEVRNNGERRSMTGKRVDDGFVITGDDGERRIDTPIVPTNHWNPKILEQERVLNTLTGNVNRVSVRRVGQESISLPSSAALTATRYRYEGELRLDSWYDPAGRWLAMSFEAKDGSTIEYRCSNCAAGDG